MLATNEDRHSELSQQLNDLQREMKDVNESIEETKLSLRIVEDQIDQLKSQQESLIKKKEEKLSQSEWLMKQQCSNSEDDLTVVKKLIEETEVAIDELSEKITELEEKIRSLGEGTEQTKIQLIKQEKANDELLQKLGEVQKQKEFLETTLEENRINYQKEIARMMFELERQEVGIMTIFLFLYSIISGTYLLLSLIILSLLVCFYNYEQSKVEMMQEELSHRREEVKIVLTRRHSASEKLNAASASSSE